MSANRTGRRPWPCYNPEHKHRTAAGAARCQATTRLSNWQPGAAALLSFEQARKRFHLIPADQRDDEPPTIAHGKFNGRACLSSVATYLLGVAMGVLSLALVLATAVGVMAAIGWAVMSGHELYALTAFGLAALAILGVQIVQVPRVRSGLAWLHEMYS